MANDTQAAEANRLYWSNAASVGEISTRLGISRRALYDLLEPQSAGVLCPECGTETVFVNRSALTSGTARCPSCEAETAVPAAREERDAQPAALPVPAAKSRPRIKVALGSVVLIGIAIGAIGTLMLTRRD